MPGYLINTPSSFEPILHDQPDTFEQFYGKIFYGLRYNPSTGKLTYERLEEGDTITYPDTQENRYYDNYASWFTSNKKITFSFANSGNFIMEVL